MPVTATSQYHVLVILRPVVELYAPQQKEQKQEEQRCEVCDEPLTLLDTYALSDSFEFIGAI